MLVFKPTVHWHEDSGAECSHVSAVSRNMRLNRRAVLDAAQTV